MVIGLDPGACGAMFWFDGDGIPQYALLDCSEPVMVATALLAARAEMGGKFDDECILALERNHSIPGMGHASAFTFGCSWGIVRGVAAGIQMPVKIVTAQAWRAHALRGRGVPKERKDREAATLAAAMERWPGLEWPKSKAKAQAVACAAFIGQYVLEGA
jgi:crossover junction endodeoxyribonuclease RuvC